MFDFMDRQVREVIDLDFILEKLQPRTPYGVEYKKNIRAYPVGTEKYLIQDLENLEAFIQWIEEHEGVGEAKKMLHSVKDVRYSLQRARGDSILSEVELYEIKAIVFTVKNLLELFKDSQLLSFQKTELVPIPALEEVLNPEGENTTSFYLYDSYSKRLADFRRTRSQLENEQRRDLRNLRLELKQSYDLSLSADSTVLLSKQDKESLERANQCPLLVFQSETFNAIVFSLKQTDEMLSIKEEIEYYKAQEHEEEQVVLRKLTREVAKQYKILKKNIHSLANLDLYIAKADMAIQMDAVKPTIVEEHVIEIEDGRYPKIQENLKKQGMEFTPISISLEKGVTCITGANMGGKTISLKIVGLLSVMAQMALFVPAKQMTVGLNEFVRTSIGDFQSTSSGLSTFGGEIENVTYAIGRAEERGLLLIDELARGTNPQEGYAISLAIAKHLQDKPSITLITTHFDQITRLEGVKHLQVIGLANINMEELDFDSNSTALKRINQYMDYRLKEVSQFTEVPKDAIQIARMMGLPEEITHYAEDALKNGW
ncbi:DNA mismatch repair protein MutS [Peptoniphilus sp. KCTC 25270]|uniref:lysine 5,6-aminomutase reactivase ATPase KamC n=1 Tax=Peptoniphilus sp. KCTC 25270 TaxID=2897414 RepID=UPI001E64183B|nr:DNA mismatch repair protein MutS [Peptoniphilus sp. KCTC 25270]MCD1147631.1 DNA mismatch repair protein MutS [Peptoniphilus sp. KCTC 25270]